MYNILRLGDTVSEVIFMESVKRSRKSRMKKRPDDWEDLKQEIAKELGLWDKVKADGWAGLSAEESGRLGGIFSARKRQAQKGDEEDENESPEP